MTILAPFFVVFVILTGVFYFVMGFAYIPLSIAFVPVFYVVLCLICLVGMIICLARLIFISLSAMTLCACESCCYVRKSTADACKQAPATTSDGECMAPDPVVMKKDSSFVSTSSAGSSPIKAWPVIQGLMSPAPSAKPINSLV
jgi:hypothetical protein